MTPIKVLMATYFLGAAVFAITLIVVVLAILGVQTVGKRIDLAWPIIGSFVLMMGSKYAAAFLLRKAEKTHG